MSKLTADEQFFYDNAGYSIAAGQTEEEGREQTALALAYAEQHARQHGWYVNWEQDDECSGCDCGSDECPCATGEPHETLYATLYDADGLALESLGGICGSTAHYRRVVGAELAAWHAPRQS